MKKLLLLLLSALTLAALEVGKPAPEITLSGDQGGRLDGTAWSSSELKGKVHLLFYVDPDEKDLNNDFSDAIKAEALDRSRFASVAIINMAERSSRSLKRPSTSGIWTKSLSQSGDWRTTTPMSSSLTKRAVSSSIMPAKSIPL